MGEIKVQFPVLDDLSRRKRGMSTKTGDIRQRLEYLRRSLDWEVGRSYSIDRNLSNICRDIEGYAEALLSMSQYLENASREYRECENGIANDGFGENSSSSFREAAETFVTQWLPLIMNYGWLPALLTNPAVNSLLKKQDVWKTFSDFWGAEVKDGTARAYIYKAGFESRSGIYKASGDIYGGTAYATSEMEASFYNSKTKSFDPTIKIAGQAGVSLAEASLESSVGDENLSLKSKLDSKVLNGEIEAGIHGGIWGYDDKGNRVFKPGAHIEVGASGSVLEADGEIRVGSEDFGAFVEGDGKVLTASAEGRLEVDFAKGEASIKGEAGAAVFEGEVTGGFDLFGYKIGVGVTGKAVAAGAEFELGYDKDKKEFVLDIGAALGLGADLKLTIKKD